MFGNEVTHMTLISNKDVCENKVEVGFYEPPKRIFTNNKLKRIFWSTLHHRPQ